jgi:hypothetical protein
VEQDVTVEDADGAVLDRVDAAYRDKYARYPTTSGDGIPPPGARPTTLRLVPRA